MLIKGRSIRVAALAMVSLAACSATGARALAYCDPETSECPPPGPPPGPPPLPSLPTQGITTSGQYRIALGTIRNSAIQEGYYQNGQTTFFGGGGFHPVGGNGSLTVTGISTSITLAPVLNPLASVSAIASANPAQDPVFTDFGLISRGGILASYLVVLHANNQSAANSLSSLLTTSGAIASISGAYDVGGTDNFWASVAASTGMNELAPALGGSFSKACSPIGYGGTPEGCGTGTYVLPLNFVNGSAYANGSPLDFISRITLSADANAGPVNLGYYIGTAHAFIDPAITFAAGINQSQFSLNLGMAPNPVQGAVPEPASWAMMIAGFGLVGATMRRRSAALPA